MSCPNCNEQNTIKEMHNCPVKGLAGIDSAQPDDSKISGKHEPSPSKGLVKLAKELEALPNPNTRDLDELDEILRVIFVAGRDYEKSGKILVDWKPIESAKSQINNLYTKEFDRGTTYGLRKALAYLDSQPGKESVRKLIIERLKKLN